MNIQKRKAILFALVAPLLLAAVACENKGCDSKVEDTQLDQVSAGKVSALFEEAKKRDKADAKKLKELYDDAVKNEATAKELAQKLDNGDSFACLLVSMNASSETSEIFKDFLVSKLDEPNAEKVLAQKCSAGAIADVVTEASRVTNKPAEDAASLDVMRAVILERANKTTLSSITDPTKMNAFAKAAKDNKKAVQKFRAALPSDKKKELDSILVAEGISGGKKATVADLLAAVKKGPADTSAQVVVNYFNAAVKDEEEIVKLAKGNFLQHLAKYPVDATTKPVWDKYIELRSTPADLTADLRNGAASSTKPLNMLLVRPAYITTDDADSLNAVIASIFDVEQAEARARFLIAATPAVQKKVFDAVLAESKFDDLYGKMLIDAANRPMMIDWVVANQANPAVQTSVRTRSWDAVAGAIDADKVNLNDIAVEARKVAPNADIVKGLYNVLVMGDATGVQAQRLLDGRANVPNHLSKLKSDGMVAIWSDLVVQVEALAAQVPPGQINGHNAAVDGDLVNHVSGGVSTFARMITDPRPATANAESAADRNAIIALMAKNGGAVAVVNNQVKANLVLTALAANSTDVEMTTFANRMAAGGAADLVRLNTWLAAADPADARANAVKGDATYKGRITNQVLVDAARDAAGLLPGAAVATPAFVEATQTFAYVADLIKPINNADFANLIALAPTGGGADRIVHFMSRLPVTPKMIPLWRLFWAKAAADNAQVILAGAGVTPFASMINNRPGAGANGEDPELRKEVIALMVQKAGVNADAVRLANDKAKFDLVANSVKDHGRAEDLQNVFTNAASAGAYVAPLGVQIAVSLWAQANAAENVNLRVAIGPVTQKSVKDLFDESDFSGPDNVNSFATATSGAPLADRNLTALKYAFDSGFDRTKADALVPAAGGQEFLHNITALPAGAETLAMVTSMLDGANSITPANIPAKVSDVGGGLAPFEKLIANRVGVADNADALKSMITLMFDKGKGGATNALINDAARTNNLLNAVLEKGDAALLTEAFNAIPAGQVADAKAWMTVNAEQAAEAFANSEVEVLEAEMLAALAAVADVPTAADFYAKYTRNVRGNNAAGIAGAADQNARGGAIAALDLGGGSLFGHHLADKVANQFTLAVMTDLVAKGGVGVKAAAGGGAYNGLTPLDILTPGTMGVARAGAPLPGDTELAAMQGVVTP